MSAEIYRPIYFNFTDFLELKEFVNQVEASMMFGTPIEKDGKVYNPPFSSFMTIILYKIEKEGDSNGEYSAENE